jgi:hypothetical protein
MRSMMKKMLSLALLTTGMGAMAQDIRLGHPAYGGNGCPAGTASASVSPDAKSLSIIFDQFMVEAGAATGRTLDRKSCNIAIPVHVPSGFSISLVAVDYRGFVSLPRGAMARLSAEYFFAGSMGPRFAQDFHGVRDQDYLFTNNLGISAQVWSPCGADVNLRVNAAMMVRNPTWQDALATVDSADVRAGIIYQIQSRRCR